MRSKKLVVVGMLGTTLDRGSGPNRWSLWRPTIALCQHEDLLIDRLELLYPRKFEKLAETVIADLRHVSPETEVVTHVLDFEDPWDLEEVYGGLLDFARRYDFRPEREDYLVHITTGTHIAQICMFLLSEARYLPARLIQTSPPTAEGRGGPGSFALIDLDLSKYDRIASRFRREQQEGLSYLKHGIATRNKAYNTLVERIEQVAVSSRDPILLVGPTGSGKTQLARRIYELKKAKRQLDGELVVVNCATMRGDAAMITLFGHVKGAFAGATEDRLGLLMRSDGGLLFMDDIAELGPEEQAMLLRAIEERSFYPVGADRENQSDFQLIAAADRDLSAELETGQFREDLLARINLWTFHLPGLRDRPEDVAPNLDYELERCAATLNLNVRLEDTARDKFLKFAASPAALWPGNFRDFAAAVRRMATLAPDGQIGVREVDAEIERLKATWQPLTPAVPAVEAPLPATGWTLRLLGPDRTAEIDDFDRVQLDEVLRVCHDSPSLSEAGRRLFGVSRGKKKVANDADRLRKYLARFGVDWKDVPRS